MSTQPARLGPRTLGAVRCRLDQASIVEAIDIYPTVASLLGIEVPPTCPVNSTLTKHCVDGRALLGAAAARGARELGGMPAGAVAYSQWAGKFAVGYTVRTSRYRYTEWVRPPTDPFAAAPRWDALVATEMYDHSFDPQESTDVAADPAHATALAGLRLQLRARQSA